MNIIFNSLLRSSLNMMFIQLAK